jgi:hypothetical protein
MMLSSLRKLQLHQAAATFVTNAPFASKAVTLSMMIGWYLWPAVAFCMYPAPGCAMVAMKKILWTL